MTRRANVFVNAAESHPGTGFVVNFAEALERKILARLALAGLVLVGCSDSSVDRWTVRQAESIRVIRGTPVTVRGCRGIGRGASGRFERFACVAGTRTATDSRDTVAVLYELRPLGPYHGRRSRYELANVRFMGGPGIP